MAYPFVNVFGLEVLGIFLSISAGALLYVGATHLLPEAGKGKYSIVAIVLGIATAILIAIAHSHG